MIADLERVLTDVPGQVAGAEDQATAELDALRPPPPPAATARAGARQGRRRGLVVALVALVLAAAAAVAVLALNARSARHGVGGRGAKPVAVALTHASAYNPYGLGGNTYQENGQAPNVIDGNPKTAWFTQEYFSGSLDKPGVGVYVWGARPFAATRLLLDTATPGFDARVEATNTPPVATSFPKSGWRTVGQANGVAARQEFRLDTHGRRYRYYLLWITSLPTHSDYAEVNEVSLYR